MKDEELFVLRSPSDLESVNISHLCTNWGYLNAIELRNCLESGQYVLYLAKKKQEVVGCCLLQVGPSAIDIMYIYVEAQYRKMGLAQKILRSIIAQYLISDKEEIFLEVRVSNIAAIKLYHKIGFENLFIKKKYYKDGEDALSMRLILK